jgi:hypothetical protein
MRGTKLWAGNCVGPELRGTTASPEKQTAPEPAPAPIPPDRCPQLDLHERPIANLGLGRLRKRACRNADRRKEQ